MVIFEQSLRDLLVSFNLVGPRVYLVRAPQVPTIAQMIPYVVFFPIGPLPHVTQTGPLSLIQRDYQLSIFDTSQSRALAIADSFRKRLDTFRGTVNNYEIASCFYSLQTWNWEQENEYVQVIQEYRVMFRNLAHPEPYTAVKTAVQTAVTGEKPNEHS